MKIKSPLRYPGGKSKALKQILPIVPSFDEFREPFVGGGSVFFVLKQLFPDKKYWINDLNTDLYSFWEKCQKDMGSLVSKVSEIKKTCKDGKHLFMEFADEKNEFDDFERAVRFFILNRITFSGTVESGGYSQQAFEKRFTPSSIKRLKEIELLMKGTKITNLDYQEVIFEEGENVFIFLDPPYLSTTKSKLYGRKGDLHSSFNHEKFAKNMSMCKHKWLITYDNSPEVRDFFSFANIYEWELQYGMNNYKQKTAEKGKELFISNYEIPSLSHMKVNSGFESSIYRSDKSKAFQTKL
jgi:DNA adenine methylase